MVVGIKGGGRGRARSHGSSGSAHYATARAPRPSRPSVGRDPFEMKHTHFFLVSPNGRADRRTRRTEGGRDGDVEGGKGPADRPGANVYPWTTATDTDTDLDLLLDRGLVHRAATASRRWTERRPWLSGA